MMTQFASGDIAGALAFAEKKHGKTIDKGDELTWLLECGSMQFYQGQHEKALDSFRRCEELIEEYDERALISLRDTGNEALVVISNENALPYRGWCRDRVSLGILKSLAYLGIGREDSFRAQVKRLREEHKKIQEDYNEFFEAEQERLEEAKAKNEEIAKKVYAQDYLGDPRNAEYVESMAVTEKVANEGYGNFLNPLSLFLSGLALARDGAWDSARIEFQRLYEALPNSPLARQYYATALLRSGHPLPQELEGTQPFEFPLERDCVYLLYAHDMTASFDQVAIYYPLMIAWPVCVYHPALLPTMGVQAEGRSYSVSPISNMDAILAQEFKLRTPARLVRTMVATLAKEAAFVATMTALERSNQNNSSSRTAVIIGTAIAYKSYQAMFNTADTRGWFTLPKEYCLTQFPMPQDRLLSLQGVPGAGEIRIPDGCGSAIVYVNAMTPAAVQCQVFPMR